MTCRLDVSRVLCTGEKRGLLSISYIFALAFRKRPCPPSKLWSLRASEMESKIRRDYTSNNQRLANAGEDFVFAYLVNKRFGGLWGKVG